MNNNVDEFLKSVNFIEIKKSIMGESGRLYGKVSPMNMFFWLIAATKSQVKSLLRENAESIKWIRKVYKLYKDHSKKLKILSITSDPSALYLITSLLNPCLNLPIK
jgi:hypothetical protein